MNATPLDTDTLKRLTLAEMNAGLQCYRADLRYSREDAVAYAAMWNQHKVSTIATIISVDGLPYIVAVDA